MAVTIDELQVETQPSSGQPSHSAPPAAPAKSAQSKTDFRTEMERYRERELRLRAD